MSRLSSLSLLLLQFFLGTFEDWFFKSVLGIQSTGVAFQTVDIAPAVTAHLASARGWMMTPFGNLSVSWANDAGSFAVDVNVPVGVTATVSFGAGSAAGGVKEGGVDVRAKAGLTVLDASNGEPMRVAVGSGTYAFVAA